MPFEITSTDDIEALEGPVQELQGQPHTPTPPSLTTAFDLYKGEVKPLKMVLGGLLYDGLTMLVARPKAGKSWLTLQIAIALAGGREIEGVQVVAPGPVLYCALEEPQARTQARLQKITLVGEWAKHLHLCYALSPLLGGGAEEVETLIQQLKPRLLILDTFTAAVKIGPKSGMDVFRHQYAEVSRLRKIAEDSGIAVLVVHHVRKGVSDSAIEAVAGTGGIAAAVDAVWLLKRKLEGEATLEVVGRETEEKTFALRFQQEPFGWQVMGDDAKQLLNGERRELLDLLKEEGALTPAKIAAELGKTRPAVRMMLKRMRADGQVEKQGDKYIPTHTVSYGVTESVCEPKGEHTQ